MSAIENQRPEDRPRDRPITGRKSKLAASRQQAASLTAHPLPPAAAQGSVSGGQLLAGAIVLAVGIWSYWPALVTMWTAWEREPDYSHGYLVVPLALLFLWVRRASFPGLSEAGWMTGLGLLGIAVATRYFSARFFFEFLDAYSVLPWLAAVVALLFGNQVLLWALPSIGFLFFMIPVPFGIEIALSHPLQRIATMLSCAALQLLGQPAFAEGNVILLGDHQLEVAQACSGLRLFISVVAMAYCYVVLVRRSWWEKLLLLVAVPPIAILSNSARIVATGLLYQFTTGEIARKFSHDLAGWAMIPLAAALFWAVLWYLGNLIREEEQVDMVALLHEGQR